MLSMTMTLCPVRRSIPEVVFGASTQNTAVAVHMATVAATMSAVALLLMPLELKFG